ncbi:MAG: AAA family ATPase [Acidimicrobiia bacterium]|nr:AAA family ATPase [Acidimicrobiia bacterium]NNL27793.1 AAA family ATPase [Acidimicrobiia bacterium]
MAKGVDVAETRERHRQRRLKRILIALSPIVIWWWFRFLSGNPVQFGLPPISEDLAIWMPGLILVALIGVVLIGPMLGNGRSPHVLYAPDQIDISFDDVKGIGPVVAEVRHTLQVFLDHRKFSDRMGGRPRRGVLFEGPPGTGKTHVAKAMAREAGVPFLFVSSTSFQSMWYGMTGRKIRSYFRALRKAARREGGAIGFIEEIDAIGAKRGGMDGSSPMTVEGMDVHPSISEGVGGVVNELLIQMQSFDEPDRPTRLVNWLIGRANRFLPDDRHLKTRPAPPVNILLIAATNRADHLDPALLRPGRFDRILHFGLPSRSGRLDLIDYFLEKKAHDPSLDDPKPRQDLASSTMGYTPAYLERMFDEALLVALKDGRDALTMPDLRVARLEVEIGLGQPTEYPQHERIAIATHEAGHATIAWLVGEDIHLDILTIIKRKDALGLLAHSDQEERFLRSKSEILSRIQISLGGMVAEELFFGESGTGPAGDLLTATNSAVEMVGSLGLGDSLVSFRTLSNNPFSGNLAAKVLGDKTSREAVDAILQTQKLEVTRLMSANLHIVEALRDALLEREELIDDEIEDVIKAAEATRSLPQVLIDSEGANLP